MGKRYISVILPLRLEWKPVYSVSDEEFELISIGKRVCVNFAHKEYVGVTDGIDPPLQTEESRIQSIVRVEDDLPIISTKEIELWEFTASYYMCTVGEVYKAAYPAGKISQEKVLARKKAKGKASVSAHNEGEAKEITLSGAQQNAFESIEQSLSRKQPALLEGVTGSGKTEIYMSLAKKVMDGGKNILYMVPEIALSRQLEGRLRSVFSDRLLVFHSGESLSARRNTADALRSGNYIVLGTRSSIFLPHHDLGLIIVDEEHDSSYKQDSPAPRYNGRDLALVMGKIHDCGVLLGSATPSLEALYNCKSGRYTHIRLTEKYYHGQNAEVRIIDTTAERRKRGMRGSLSIKLIEELARTLENGGKAVIFRGRRAYSPLVQCEECGDIPKCFSCNVSMSYHKDSGRLVCHHCGRSYKFTGTCNHKNDKGEICGGKLIPIGSGTQKIEEELTALFPDAGVVRLDSDTAKDDKQAIKDFESGKARILVGTQMVTKGFDFEDLDLVAVICADSITGQESFRADERSLQIFEQFRGRCARRERKGVFVIQTAQPSHPVYQSLGGVNPSVKESLLGERLAFGYPPFHRMINIIMKDKNLQRIDVLSSSLSAAICSSLGIQPDIAGTAPSDSIRLTGPFPPVIDRVAGEYIRHIRILIPRRASLQKSKDALRRIIADFESARKWSGHIAVDVDPQ